MNKLVARRVSILTTLRCTLKCKLCSNCMTMFENPQDIPLRQILNDIDGVFELFDHVIWFQFVGGEIFLNKDMKDVFEYTLKYLDCMDKLILMTNATILPTQEEFEVLSKYGKKIEVLFSDYGNLSYRIEDFCSSLRKYEIPYTRKNYHGDEQYFGGWIDNTKMVDLGETWEELCERTAKCPQVSMMNMLCLNGHLHRCRGSCIITALGKTVPNDRDYVDLNNNSVSIEVKRDIVRGFYEYPRASCRVCSWTDTVDENATRYPAAEQL